MGWFWWISLLFCVGMDGASSAVPHDTTTTEMSDRLLALSGRSYSSAANFQCKICSQCCTSQPDLESHLYDEHKDDFVGFCVECGKGFRSFSGLNYHKKMHESDSVTLPTCGVCGKQFPSRSRLVYHERSHSEDKPFICVTCGRSYKHNKNLKEHNCNANMPAHIGIFGVPDPMRKWGYNAFTSTGTRQDLSGTVDRLRLQFKIYS